MRSRLARSSAIAAFSFIVVLGSTQLLAGKPGGGGTGSCPRSNFCLCAQIYCPVTCANNCHYSNACVANCAGATACVQDGPCDFIQ
jgi:hypothetical protein